MGKCAKIKRCSKCGLDYTPASNAQRYCFDCRELMKDEYEKNRANNDTCECCGKLYYRRHCQEDEISCCSSECSLRLNHQLGKAVYWKCIEEEHGISLKETLHKMHNIDMVTLKDIAECFKIDRRNLMNWFKLFNIEHRDISGDNYRRYANMSEEEIKNQTKAANKKIRELMKDEEYKALHVKRTLDAQNNRESEPERMVKIELDCRGIEYHPHYQITYNVVDLAFPQQKIAIEIDGDYWHSTPRQKDKDRIRDERLKKIGWKILRIKEFEVRKDVKICVDKIEQFLTAE